MWDLIAQHPEQFVGFEVTDTSIHLPNWSGYYLKQDPTSLGVKKTDTMREIVGTIAQITSQGPEGLPTTGAFSTYKYGTTSFIDSFNGDSEDGIKFSSKTGIAGQEGTVSPNVGAETEPKNIGVIYAICGRIA